MPIVTDFGFCGPTYSGVPDSGGTGGGVSRVWDSERCVNFYPEPDSKEGRPKTRAALVGRPGLQLFTTLPTGPVRALWSGSNRLFAVGGSHLYEVSSVGAVITDYGAMAGSLGTGPCQILSNANQLLVMDSAVPSAGQVPGAVFMIQGGAMLRVFLGSALAYLDGFYFAISNNPGASPPTTADINKVFVSDLLNGASWGGLNFIQRTGAPDLLLQLETLNGQMWMFGQETIEVWYDAGNPTFPLVRVQGATINLGLLPSCRFSVVKFNNTLLWIASDRQGYCAVYMADGLSPVRVSNPGVEYMLSNFANAGVTGAANTTTAYGYREAGHVFYCINLPTATNYAGLPGLTLCYDLTTGLWHERTYLNGGVASVFPIMSVACEPGFGASSASFVFAGDSRNGNIYYQSLETPNDNGVAIEYVRRAPHIADGNRWVKYVSLEVDADIGTAQMQLDYSNDGGRTFPAGHRRGPQAASGGTAAYGSAGGGFGRFKWWQLGRSRDRVFQTTIRDSVNRIRLQGAYLDAQPGTEIG